MSILNIIKEVMMLNIYSLQKETQVRQRELREEARQAGLIRQIEPKSLIFSSLLTWKVNYAMINWIKLWGKKNYVSQQL